MRYRAFVRSFVDMRSTRWPKYKIRPAMCRVRGAHPYRQSVFPHYTRVRRHTLLSFPSNGLTLKWKRSFGESQSSQWVGAFPSSICRERENYGFIELSRPARVFLRQGNGECTTLCSPASFANYENALLLNPKVFMHWRDIVWTKTGYRPSILSVRSETSNRRDLLLRSS